MGLELNRLAECYWLAWNVAGGWNAECATGESGQAEDL